MADKYIVTALVITWDVDDEGNAKLKDKDPMDDIFTATQEDNQEEKIKRQLLAGWLKKEKDINKIKEKLEKIDKGLITIEITGKTLVQTPEIDEETKAKKAREIEDSKSDKLSSDIAKGVGKAIGEAMKKGGKP